MTVYGTTHAHLVHMCGPMSWALHQMGHSFATFGTYTLVGSLRWVMSHESWVMRAPKGMPCTQCARSAKFWMSANTPTLATIWW